MAQGKAKIPEPDDVPVPPETEAPVTAEAPAGRYRLVLVSGVCHGVVEEGQ